MGNLQQSGPSKAEMEAMSQLRARAQRLAAGGKSRGGDDTLINCFKNLTQISSCLAQLRDERSDLNSQCMKLESSRNHLQKDVTILQKRVDYFEKRLSEKRATRDMYKELYDETVANAHNDLAKHLESMTLKLDEHKTKLEFASKDVVIQEKRLKKMKSYLKRHNDELVEVEAKIADRRKELGLPEEAFAENSGNTPGLNFNGGGGKLVGAPRMGMSGKVREINTTEVDDYKSSLSVEELDAIEREKSAKNDPELKKTTVRRQFLRQKLVAERGECNRVVRDLELTRKRVIALQASVEAKQRAISYYHESMKSVNLPKRRVKG